MNCYALFEIGTPNVVRYVGVTSGRLKKRLASHLSDISDSPKTRWMESVKLNNSTIGIRLLSHHKTPEEASKAERKWIQKYRCYSELTNISNGSIVRPFLNFDIATVNIQIPKNADELFREEARRKMVSKSAVIRDVLCRHAQNLRRSNGLVALNPK